MTSPLAGVPVTFLGSFPDPLHALTPAMPEFAFVGRSNVGKSSLLNALTGRRNLARVSQQRHALGPDFIQLSGEDMTALAFNAAGGIGCISVVSNVAPRLCADMQEASLRGDYASALKIQDRLVPLHDAVFREPGLAGAKLGLSLLGRGNEEVRLPLLPVQQPANRAAVKAAMVHAGLING